MATVSTALRLTSQLVSSHRRLWLPFAAALCVEFLFIALLWLAPHPPFSIVLAPPIRYVFGERMLHYPWHLWWLYDSMQYSHAAATALIGAYMTGVACEMVRQTHTGRPLSLRDALISGHVRYGTVTFLWLLMWLLSHGMMRMLGHLPLSLPWLLGAMVVSAALLQALLAYAIPAAVFCRSRWWRALGQGIREVLRHPVSTLLVILGPTLVVAAFSIVCSPTRVAAWMVRVTPEIALGCVLARLALWTIVDAWMTVAVAHLWWVHRRPVGAQEHAAAIRVVSGGDLRDPAVA